MRIAKAIADSGHCSRREAERLILRGIVKLNGKIIDSPALNISSDDIISINDKEISQPPKPSIWILHKPIETITSNSDPEGRTTIFDILPKNLPRLITVGRLDYYSEGLLLLTNNGELARKLELPSSKIKRVYKVRVRGELDIDELKQVEKGITIQGVNYIANNIKVINSANLYHNLEIELSEGKNREIRNILSFFDLRLLRLQRISYGDFKLGNLAIGEVIEADAKLVTKQINQLK